MGMTGTLARWMIWSTDGCHSRSWRPWCIVVLLMAPAGKKPTGSPSRSCLMARRIPATLTARLAGSLLAQASTAMKLGRMADIFSSIMLTITLYFGRRDDMRYMSMMPSRAPNGWLLTVMNGPSGRLSSTSWPSMRSFMRKPSKSMRRTNSGPGVSQKRRCMSLTLSTDRKRSRKLTRFSCPSSFGTMRRMSS